MNWGLFYSGGERLINNILLFCYRFHTNCKNIKFHWKIKFLLPHTACPFTPDFNHVFDNSVGFCISWSASVWGNFDHRNHDCKFLYSYWVFDCVQRCCKQQVANNYNFINFLEFINLAFSFSRDQRWIIKLYITCTPRPFRYNIILWGGMYAWCGGGGAWCIRYISDRVVWKLATV